MGINLKAIFDDLHEASTKHEDNMYTIENAMAKEYWLQITDESINAYYPYAEEPSEIFQDIGIALYSKIVIADWQANQFVTLNYDSSDLKKAVGFVRSYLAKVLNYDDTSDDWTVLAEIAEEKVPVESELSNEETAPDFIEWSHTGWEWNSKKHKWKQKPILTIDGKDFSYKTRQAYIDKMSSLNYSDENLLSSIAVFQDSIDNYPEILSKNIFSKIGIGFVITGLSIVAIALIFILYEFKPEEFRELLPVDCIKSDFFWLLLAVGTVYAIFSVGFTNYTPVVESGGKTSVSYDMTDQVGAGFMTLLSPVLTGAALALIPYYILYWLMGVISETNYLILSAIIIGVFALVILGFVKSRPKFRRKREVIWIIVWSLITFTLLRLTLGYFYLY